MPGPAETLSFVARRLIQHEQRFDRSAADRKREAAELFSRIAAGLFLLLDNLRRDQLPHEACRELALCSSRLKECVAEEVGEAEADRLARSMGEASDKERLYVQFRSAEDKKFLSEELEKAGILLQALANGLGVARFPGPGPG